MISGSIVAIATPMNINGDINYNELENLIHFHIENETNAIVSVGTTGEGPTLTVDEHINVIKFTVEKVAKRIPVIAGTGGNSTHESIELTQMAKDVGADACLLVAPYYNKPTQEGLYQHFKTIAENVAIPQLLYNVPSRTASDILPETVLRLSEIKNIIGIKEATGDLNRAATLLAKVPNDFYIYSGDDASAGELILMGGKGNISVTANVAPREMSRLCSLALSGNKSEMRALNEFLMPLHKAMFCQSNPIPVKFALEQMKLISSGIRLPLTRLDTQYHNQVIEALKLCKIIA